MRSSKVMGLVAVLSGWVFLADGATSARAANKLDENLATTLGKDVVLAAHPSAKDPALLEYKETTAKDGRLVLNIKMKFFGKLTSAKYTADIKVTIDTTKEPPRVVDVEYSDDDKIPSSKKKLKDVEDTLTKKLPKSL